MPPNCAPPSPGIGLFHGILLVDDGGGTAFLSVSCLTQEVKKGRAISEAIMKHLVIMG
jgi:hypothetical protein